MADNKAQNSSTNSDSSVHIPTKRELTIISSFIAITTLIAVTLFVWAFNRMDGYQLKVRKEAAWDNKEHYPLAAGPSWFLYNKSEGKLMTLQMIDDSSKTKLLALYNADSLGFNAYSSAIEELTFATNEAPKPSYLITLLIGGIAAVLGVQVRSVHRFILRVCYFNNLEFKRWWPWYVMRPVMGFMVGCAVILLADINLLSIANKETNLYFWTGLAFIAGFGASDVVGRLYDVTRTIFGTDDGNRQLEEDNSNHGKEDKPDGEEQEVKRGITSTSQKKLKSTHQIQLVRAQQRYME